ncbi:MAG: gamma carbonic anhydrase family protein [Flavobacteriales bacterium]|nr:gamma carbonic anhydrase family protein [Flavobacteriales bacterium]|tara:strand:+ start:2530 stop:3042 length:513 start_codon:yes stop_codon:yes gene_type:complete
MAIIKSLRGFDPQWGDDCFIAENATLIGDLIMGDQCSVWYNAVIRADVHQIRIGDRVNVQDGAVIHCTYQKADTQIGNDVSIGHNALVHGCKLHDKVLVGMGSIVMDDAEVESYSIIAAGAVVTQGTKISAGSIYAGMPAKKIGEVSDELRNGEIERIAKNYIKYSSWYK